MEIQEKTKKTLNFVYDSWVLDIPHYNLGELIGNGDFRDEYGFFDFYQRFFNTQLPEKYDRKTFEVKKCKISDVYENPNELYYYGIKTSFSLYDIFGEREWKFSDSLVKCLRECENIKVLFIREHEPETYRDFECIVNYLDTENIPHNRFSIISNNPKINDYKKEFSSDIIFHRTNLLQITSSSVWNELGSELVKNKTGSFFSCFNKSPKRHRISTLICLQQSGVLKDVNWSMLVDYRSGRGYDEELYEDFEYLIGPINNGIEEHIDSILNRGDKKSDYEENSANLVNGGFEKPNIEIGGAGGESGGIMVPESNESHNQSYVNIVTESIFEEHWNAIHVTEKSTRPFFYYQLPIIIATKGHIKFMEEEFGFDFYRDLIDHSYNDIQDDFNRFQGAIKEIKRLQNNKEKVIEYYHNNIDRLEKNKQIVSNLPNNDQDMIYFLNVL